MIVTGEFPDVVVLAGRKFAGDGVVFGAWYSSVVHQDRTVEKLRRERALFVLHMDAYDAFRTRYPLVDAFVTQEYEPMAEVPVEGAGSIRILVQGVRRIEVTGRLRPGVYAKDVILDVIGRLGVNGGVGYAYEYAGDTFERFSMEERMTVCNMSIEGGARCGYVNPDATTYAYLRGRPFAPPPEAWDRASPITRVNPEAPPWFLIHGDADTLVPVGEARHFAAALASKTRAPLAYAELHGAQHAFELFPSVRTLHAVNAVHRFLAWVQSDHLRQRRAAARAA